MGRGTRESLSEYQGPPNKRTNHAVKTYFLWTDASDNGIGTVLMQEHDGKPFPACYRSRKSERNCSIIEPMCGDLKGFTCI